MTSILRRTYLTLIITVSYVLLPILLMPGREISHRKNKIQSLKTPAKHLLQDFWRSQVMTTV